MKRQYSQNGNRAILQGGRLIALIVAVIVIALLILRLVFPAALISLASPLWSVGNMLTAAVGSATLSFESEDAVREERDRLRAELTARTNEYHILRAELGDAKRLGDTESRTTAGVLARPPVSPYDTLIVVADAAVTVGAQAYGAGGIPVGTVSRADGESAHISLYSAPGRTTDGWAGEARTPVSLIGAGSGAFRASVAKDTPIAVGEQVFVPGPGALPIGTIVRIDTDPSSPSATLFIQPPRNPFSLAWVSIAL